MHTSLSTTSGKWQFWVDRGGTFTDIVAKRPDGQLVTKKLLSENPEQYRDAAVAGIKELLGVPASQSIDPAQIAAVKMGTTVATNALLERAGEPVALFITRGFRDAIRIAYQNRPRLFDRQIVLPELLYREVVEVDERIAADGAVVHPLDEVSVQRDLTRIYDKGIRAVAVVLMHGYRFHAHEARIAEMARATGFTQISVSHRVSPTMKLVARGDTTIVDAYLSPILKRYVDQVAAELGTGLDAEDRRMRLMFMQSNGGLTDAARFSGKDSILSGPAGGIVGMARTSAEAGFHQVIGFDMGGTSTDVSHYAGEFERVFETQVAGVRMRAPMMSIHTVAAGGGSILHFDGSRFRVGPDSAGANPGPACYRRGGPLAVTDCNVMLGKIQPDHFPAVFGPKANERLDKNAVERAFAVLAEQIERATGLPSTPEAIAEGFIEIAVGNMANAIKQISVQRGYDVTEYVLATFGGAGGQHACLVADALGMTRIFVHPLAGVLSAYGMGLADETAMRERAVELPLADQHLATVKALIDTLANEAREELTRDNPDARIEIKAQVHLRYQGTDNALTVPLAELDQMRSAFETSYRRRYSFLMPGRALIIEAVHVEAIAASPASSAFASDAKNHQAGGSIPAVTISTASDSVRMYSGGQWRDTGLYLREDLLRGQRIDGPAIIVEANATTVVEKGWQAELTSLDHLVLARVEALPQRRAIGTTANPVMLEVFNNLFMSIAEQMGLRLQNTAHSVNIKERLDFSCALFDTNGDLIANAPHIPVHLGSMGESIKVVIRENRDRMVAGDVFMLNDPYHGGTHLPDVTVVTPVFDPEGKEVWFYVGSRGHHADIGGTTPGSMPPDSTVIEEEGVLFNNVLLVDGKSGLMCEAEVRDLLLGARYPARNPDQNLADMRAQVAANQKGVEELHRMVDHFGLDVVKAYMGHVQDNAEEAVRRVVSVLHDGSYSYRLDNGALIEVAIRVDREKREAVIDFTGTSMQLQNNFNAPSAICMAAVLYVFRTLVDDDIPLNAGCLKPLRVIIPEGSMLSPSYPASVVSGNVETSSCITNALYGALGLMASSQGTMNNFTFGNQRYQYYETISGGSGAGNGFDGTDAVQTHMTNSRLTDPEVLEFRYPVRLESFEIRQGSGGAGQWHGGNGTIRRVRFLEEMTASILSNNRSIGPFGMAGGASGAMGRNHVERLDGSEEVVPHVGSALMRPGDMFVIETPGGGGYGKT
jgi:5-oxoprolinase (ATP-hydrolysing)